MTHLSKVPPDDSKPAPNGEPKGQPDPADKEVGNRIYLSLGRGCGLGCGIATFLVTVAFGIGLAAVILNRFIGWPVLGT